MKTLTSTDTQELPEKRKEKKKRHVVNFLLMVRLTMIAFMLSANSLAKSIS